MRFGLSFPLAGVFSDVRVVAELAKEAEDAGWDGCFVWDHLSIGGAPPLADPWIALTLIASATERIRLGPLVTPLFRRHPAKLAFETVTLDHLSKGRLVMGVGLGSDIFGELSAFGGPLDDRVRAEMLDEGLTVLTALWSGQPLSFEGKHYRLEDARILPPCLQSPRIPIWIAASWPRNKGPVRRAARYDGVVPVSGEFAGTLSTGQIRELLSYIQTLRSPHAPFEIIHLATASSAGPGGHLVEEYADAGATWWIEAMPFDAKQFGQTRNRIRLGPSI